MTFGQNYVWPTRTGKQLTSNFGEFRDNHFHMGLDIRTKASSGHPIFAVNDGYVYRISTNFRGFGKAIYLKTNDNKIAVYGHLGRFSKSLEKRLFELQGKNQSYFVNKYFLQDEYLVKRGEIMGYSGNSGGSMGPHLHFELRNDQDQPLNPLTNGFPLVDNVPPIFMDLSIIPLVKGTHISNSPLPQSYSPVPLSSTVYTLKDTISITGTFGITTYVIDKIQTASYSYQIEKLELLIDSVSAFTVNYNLLDFSEGKSITTVYGQPIDHPKHDDFQKLYRLNSYPKLTIHNDNNNDAIDLSEGIHKIEINAWDSAQNKSILTFYIRSTASEHSVKHKTSLNLNEYPIFDNNNLFKPELIQLEKGTAFQIQTNIGSQDTFVAFIEKSDMLITFPLIKIDSDRYASNLINLNLFKNSQSCGFLFYSDSIRKYEFDFIPTLVFPDSKNTLFSIDSLCSVHVENAFYDTTLMWIIKYNHFTKFNLYNSKSNVYELYPYGIPFKNNVNISLAVDKDSRLEKCAIYTFNKKKSKWNYVSSSIDTTTNSITAKIKKPNIFSVLEDSKPPWFNYTYPKSGNSYLRDNIEKFKIIIDDDLSGINSSEKFLQVFLNEERIWVAYQPIEREISYNLRKSLSIGEHNLLINIHDRSGNSASKSIKFFIE